MNEQKRDSRDRAYAKVIFPEDNLPGYVRDISKTGCRIDLVKKVSWTTGEKKKIVIVPEEHVGFAPVHGTVEVRWLRPGEIYNSVGVRFISVQDEDSKKNYKFLLKFFESK
jgi:hypothetical protein